MVVGATAGSSAASALGPLGTHGDPGGARAALLVVTGVTAGVHLVALALQRLVGPARSRFLEFPRTQLMLLRFEVPLCAQIGSSALVDAAVGPGERVWGALLVLVSLALVGHAWLCVRQVMRSDARLLLSSPGAIGAHPLRVAAFGRLGVDAVWVGEYARTHGPLFENGLDPSKCVVQVLLTAALVQALLAGAVARFAARATLWAILVLQVGVAGFLGVLAPFIDSIRMKCANVATLLCVTGTCLALSAPTSERAEINLAVILLRTGAVGVALFGEAHSGLKRVHLYDSLLAAIRDALSAARGRRARKASRGAALLNFLNTSSVRGGGDAKTEHNDDGGGDDDRSGVQFADDTAGAAEGIAAGEVHYSAFGYGAANAPTRRIRKSLHASLALGLDSLGVSLRQNAPPRIAGASAEHAEWGVGATMALFSEENARGERALPMDGSMLMRMKADSAGDDGGGGGTRGTSKIRLNSSGSGFEGASGHADISLLAGPLFLSATRPTFAQGGGGDGGGSGSVWEYAASPTAQDRARHPAGASSVTSTLNPMHIDGALAEAGVESTLNPAFMLNDEGPHLGGA